MGYAASFVVSLISGFVSSGTIKALLTRLGVLLGVTAITYTGISLSMTTIEGSINSALGSSSANLLTMLTILKVPAALNVILSSYVGALTLKGLSAAGAVTKYGTSAGAGTVFSPGTF
jgi:hypothetical protein